MTKPYSNERRILISGLLVGSRRITGDTIGQQYIRYLPTMVPKPDEIGQAEEKARNGNPKYVLFASYSNIEITRVSSFPRLKI